MSKHAPDPPVVVLSVKVNTPVCAAIAPGAFETDNDPNIAASICFAMFLPKSAKTAASALCPFFASITFEMSAYPVNLFGVNVTFVKF